MPITLRGRLESRPIMSMLIMAVIEGRGTVGSFTKWLDPNNPNSSPAKVINRTDRLKACLFRPINRASSRTPAVPEALSSAP